MANRGDGPSDDDEGEEKGDRFGDDELVNNEVSEAKTAASAEEIPKARPNFPIVVKTNRFKPTGETE